MLDGFSKMETQTTGHTKERKKQRSKKDGSWKTTWEGTWKVTGGTGKFKNIKGGGTYRGKATAQEALTEWEGEVEY
jgi:hypothetical protein